MVQAALHITYMAGLHVLIRSFVSHCHASNRADRRNPNPLVKPVKCMGLNRSNKYYVMTPKIAYNATTQQDYPTRMQQGISTRLAVAKS